MAASVGAIVANIYYAQPLLPDIARTFGLSATGIGVFARTHLRDLQPWKRFVLGAFDG
jgi:hypothetical protein